MNNIEPKYVTFEQAKYLDYPFLTETGYSFDKNIIQRKGYIATNGWINRPEQWQVCEWLRVNHGIWVSPGIITLNGVVKWFPRYFKFASTLLEISEDIDGNFDTPQEAYSAAFDYIKDNNLI